MSVDRTSLALCVDVLGPLRLRVEGRPVEVPGVRRRALLALLALAGSRPVGTGRLVECLWPEGPPDNALQALYNHVSRVRGHLGPLSDRLQRHGAGYRLQLAPDELDAEAARRLARALSEGASSPATAAALARSALDLWRGPALEEFRTLPALEAESVGLDELHLQLVDDLLEARLALGDRAVPVDAAAAAASAPLRERTALLQVRSLAADGRSAEAMGVAQQYRRRLVEETGLDPSPALSELEQSVAAGAVPVAVHGAPVARRAVSRPDGPLVGRQHDRQEVLRLLTAHGVVTVTGPGGVGKTRLALDVAADPGAAPGPEADVVVADLAAVDRAERVPAAVASVLGLRTAGEVRAEGVAEGLRDRRLLLVLDNCEHLPGACRELVTTVRRLAPGVRVLATSRVTLHVPGEYVVRLQPLPVPRGGTDLAALRRQPGVRAFVEHARRRNADYDLREQDAADLVEVLRRLDGLPLGIELAARQVAVIPLRAVRERLDRALDLTGGRPPDADRRPTLRATIGSSHRLLGEPERRLLGAIAPFPGGVDLATVEALAQAVDEPGDPLDLLHRLVDSSLLVADPERGRYRLLFTVRDFLLDDLRAREALAEAENRFLDRVLAVAGEIGELMAGPEEQATDRWLRAELDNLRAAWDVAEVRGRDDVRVGITVSLGDAATWRDLRELWTWALELAADPRLVGHPDRAAVLASAAEAARLTGDLDGAERLADEALAAAGPDPAPELHRAWAARGAVAHFRGDFAAARRDWVRSAEGSPRAYGAFLASAALAAAYGGDREAARELLDRAHAGIARTRCGSQAAFAAYVEGELRAAEDVDGATACYLAAIEGARGAGTPFVAGVASVALASARTRTGDVAAAAEGFAYLIDQWRRTGQRTQLWTTVRNAAGLLSAVGRSEVAALMLLCAESAPGAAAVGPEIARRSGRTFTPVEELVDAEGLDAVRAEAARLGTAGVLDRAVTALRELAGP